MKRSVRRLLGLALLAGVAATLIRTVVFPRARYTVRALGSDVAFSTRAEGFITAAADINNRGEVLGTASGADATGKARSCLFVVRGGRTVRLAAPFERPEAMAISDRGDILYRAGISPRRVFLRSGARTVELTVDGFPVANAALAPDGAVVGSLDEYRGRPAVLRANGRAIPLPPPAGTGKGSSAAGVNARHTVAGSYGVRGCLPVLWRNGVPEALPLPAGSVEGGAYAVDEADRAVGCYDNNTDHGPRACLWERGRVRDLAPKGTISAALAMNNRGQVVGYRHMKAKSHFDWNEWPRFWEMAWSESAPRAALFENGKALNLNDAIPPRSGWVLEEAVAINDAGQIVGKGYYHGEERGFLLTPVKR